MLIWQIILTDRDFFLSFKIYDIIKKKCAGKKSLPLKITCHLVYLEKKMKLKVIIFILIKLNKCLKLTSYFTKNQSLAYFSCHEGIVKYKFKCDKNICSFFELKLFSIIKGCKLNKKINANRYQILKFIKEQIQECKPIKKETFCMKKYPCWYIKKFPTRTGDIGLPYQKFCDCNGEKLSDCGNQLRATNNQDFNEINYLNKNFIKTVQKKCL